MRCSICGYDVEAPLTRCPMCGGVIVHPSQPDGPAEEVSQVQIEAEVQDQPETGTPEISFRDAQLVRTFVPAWEEPRAPRSAEIESISWDTKDFARPKKVQDIEMQWPEYTKHNLFAASDGPEKTEKPSKEEVPVQSDQIVQTAADRPERFMSVRDAEDLAAKYEKTEPSAPENVKAEAPAVKYESAEALAAKYESAESLAAKYESTEVSEAEYGPAAEYKPEAEYGPGSGSASSDPEEPVIDALGSEDPAVDPSEPEIAPTEIEEPDNIPDTVPTEPEAPEIAAAEPETPETTSPEQEAEPSSDAFEFTVEGLMRQASEPDEEPEVTSDEDKTKTFRVEDLIPEQKGSERPMFYTFQTKTDEFQKLLDKEYERIHSMYGEDYDPLKGATVPPFEPEEKVQAQSLSDFERMLMEDVPEQKEQTAAQKFFSQSPADASAEEQPIDFDSEDWKMSADPTKMTIEQIENTIRELEADEIREAEQSSERKKRLEAMAAARDEYFRNLDRYDKRGRLIKKKDQEPVSAPAPEVRPSELTAEDLVKARDAAEPADTIIRDISRNAYTPAADAEAATPEGPKTDASYEPKSFDDIYQSIFGVRPVSSENRAAEAPAVSKDVSEPLAVSEAPAAAEAGPSVSKAASAAAPVAAAVAGIAAAAAIKSEVSEPAAPAEESALTASAADTADRLAPEQEMEKKLEELEKLYSVDTAEAKAETHNSPAISFFFDQEAPQQISDADELLDVNEIIEEKPFDKDDLTITNETSSLAFLYDDIPDGAGEDVLSAEQLENVQTDIPLDNTWADIWEKPGPAAEPEVSEIQPETEAVPQPEAAQAEPEEIKTAYSEPEETETAPAATEEAETAPAATEETEPARAEPEEDDVKIFRKSRHEEAAEQDGPEEEPDEDEKEVTTSSHVVLKIIAVLLVLCALFEGATLLLANIAPDADITHSLLGIEESVVGSISSFFSGIFGSK